MKKNNFIKKYLEIDFKKVNKETFFKIGKKFKKLKIASNFFEDYNENYTHSDCYFLDNKDSDELCSCLAEDFYSKDWQDRKGWLCENFTKFKKITIEDFLK